MKTIYKYTLGPVTRLELPYDAEILSVQVQHNEVVLWAMVESEPIQTVERNFVAVPTGGEIPYDPSIYLQFLGTVQLHGGSLVFHIFEILKSDPSVNRRCP